MIVLMQNNPGGNAIECFNMGLKFFIHIFQCYRFIAVNIFSYFGDA